MHSLQTVAHGLDPQQLTPSAELDLTRRSGQPPVPPSVALAVAMLMQQVRDLFPHQELDPGTARMYTAAWTETALKYGPPHLAESLRALLRDESRPNFFPAPGEVRAWSARLRQTQYAQRQRRMLHEEDERNKALWEQERAEDLARGIPRGADAQAESAAFLASAMAAAVKSDVKCTAE